MLFGKVIAQTRGWTFVWLLLAPAFITETQVMSSQDCSLLLPPLPVTRGTLCHPVLPLDYERL